MSRARMGSTSGADQEFDFIVVGGGTAGAVVAARLSEHGQVRVLLLEAGPPDRSPWIHLPIGFSKTFHDPRLNWRYESDPEPHLHGRQLYWPKGKVLGGSSSINGLIYLRGLPSDFDHWCRLGNPSWSYDQVEPFFRRLEGVHDVHGRAIGGDGPMRMSPTNWRTELSEAFIAAAQTLTGSRRDDGFNAGEQFGGGYFMLTQHRGRRSSSATAYLRATRRRGTLRVLTGALATRLEFERGHARHVLYLHEGQTCRATASREIVLAGGAINTPQLLQLSGVGPAPVLERAGVRPVHELPGVGADLHDHFTARYTLRTGHAHCTMNGVAGNWTGKARVGLQWALHRSGPLTIGAGVAGAFVKTDSMLVEPDAQFILVPFKTDKAYSKLTADAGFQLLATQSRPRSRGHLAIRNADPRARPFMIANYLDVESDRRCAVASLRLARQLLATAPLAPFVQAELSPGPAARSDDELLEFARQTGGSTQHHVGSCRMGADAMAVVDDALRVHGVTGLRIADASVMPQVVSANTNGAVLMIGERCAAFIAVAHADCFGAAATPAPAPQLNAPPAAPVPPATRA